MLARAHTSQASTAWYQPYENPAGRPYCPGADGALRSMQV
jgi:hypothetical protein